MSHRKAVRELRGESGVSWKLERKAVKMVPKPQRAREDAAPVKAEILARIRDVEDVLWVARLKKRLEMLVSIQTLGKKAGVGVIETKPNLMKASPQD